MAVLPITTKNIREVNKRSFMIKDILEGETAKLRIESFLFNDSQFCTGAEKSSIEQRNIAPWFCSKFDKICCPQPRLPVEINSALQTPGVLGLYQNAGQLNEVVVPVPTSLLQNRYTCRAYSDFVGIPPGSLAHSVNRLPVQFPMYLQQTSPKLEDSKHKKCRRSRTVFTELQLMGLEKRFESQKYLSTPDRIELAEKLSLSQLQVKTWYQNRRMKWKKQVLQGGGLEAPTKPKGRPKKAGSLPKESGSRTFTTETQNNLTKRTPFSAKEWCSNDTTDSVNDELSPDVAIVSNDDDDDSVKRSKKHKDLKDEF